MLPISKVFMTYVYDQTQQCSTINKELLLETGYNGWQSDLLPVCKIDTSKYKTDVHI